MDLYIMDETFTDIGIMDRYKSVIWAKRYLELGDCEIYVPATKDNLNLMLDGKYIRRNDDDMICRIESVEIDTDEDEGDYLIIRGFDCRKILSQRIIWSQTNFSGTVEDFIRKLITDNIINPSLTSRKIENFVLGQSNGFTETISEQVTYDQLDEKVMELCQTYGYGSKVTFDPDSKVFTFNLYRGADRSYAQDTNDFVVFSPEFGNLITSKYIQDASGVRNVALVGGEGEGASRKNITVGTASGLDRYEVFIDADDISSDVEEGVTIDYDEALRSRGLDELSEYGIITSFEGEVEPNYSYKYKLDYNLGDIVQVMNEYGIEASAMITEVIESDDDANGYSVIPTFEYQYKEV